MCLKPGETEGAERYFSKTVLPMIRERHPEVWGKMSVLVLGSVGLGIDDSASDMEAAIYLEREDWNRYGGALQLSLNRLLEATNLWNPRGSIICVHPASWLLDFQADRFRAQPKDPPWEEVSMTTLFTMQNNLILHDPRGLLGELRDMTSPSRYPSRLWKKALLRSIHQLIAEDAPELEICARREHYPEAAIVLGDVLEQLFSLGFMLCRQYYPWRKHLSRAFRLLPDPVAEQLPALDVIASASDWRQKLEAVDSVLRFYIAYIKERNLLDCVDFDAPDPAQELLWAQRLKAWENPDWRKFIDDKTRLAVQNGCPPGDFWVWSLWQWDK